MKRSIILAFAVVVSSAFLSCSNDEDMLIEEQGKELFNSYQLKRDATGAYSIEFDANVNISKTKNSSTNTNELYLSMSNENLTQKSNVQTDLFFEDENFKVNFITKSGTSLPSIAVFDDNIKFAKKSEDSFLEEYSVSANEDGTYNLDFTVGNKISVDFVYDSLNNIYEIHLAETVKNNNTNSYSKTFEKEDNKRLQIQFVNHIEVSAKGTSEFAMAIKKPVVIIDN